MPAALHQALSDALGEIIDAVAAHDHQQWRLYELHTTTTPGDNTVTVDTGTDNTGTDNTGGDSVGTALSEDLEAGDRGVGAVEVEAHAVADLGSYPATVLLGRPAPAADGVLLAYGGGRDLQVCAVLINGVEAHRGRSEELLAPVLRRWLGLPSRATHPASVEVARGFACGVLLSLVRRGCDLGDRDLGRRFAANFATELAGGDPWHENLRHGLGGQPWGRGAVEEALSDWVDEDLALALLATRSVTPTDTRQALGALIGEKDAAEALTKLLGKDHA